MAIKIDMEQEYDKMSWDTLNQVLNDMNFPSKFNAWILECATYLNFLMMINGARTEWINAQCGFYQGCPLPLYLFILCSELLLLAFSMDGQFLGMEIMRNASHISHLLYPDDILITSIASSANAKPILKVLDIYCH